MSVLERNQSIQLQGNLVGWFLYDQNIIITLANMENKITN